MATLIITRANYPRINRSARGGRRGERERERPGRGGGRDAERACERPEAGEAHYRYCCNKPSNNSDKYEREAGVTNVSLSYDYLARSRPLIRPFVGSFVRSYRLPNGYFRSLIQDVSGGKPSHEKLRYL